MMPISDSFRVVQIAPHLMLLTVKQLTKENAELCEEVKQLRAAVNVYRELANRNGLVEQKRSPSAAMRAHRQKPNTPCRSNVA